MRMRMTLMLNTVNKIIDDYNLMGGALMRIISIHIITG